MRNERQIWDSVLERMVQQRSEEGYPLTQVQEKVTDTLERVLLLLIEPTGRILMPYRGPTAGSLEVACSKQALPSNKYVTSVLQRW